MGKIERHQDSKRDLQKSNQRKEETRQAGSQQAEQPSQDSRTGSQQGQHKQAVNRKQGHFHKRAE
jgi:hypothetical protein